MNAIREWWLDVSRGWNKFWFTPTDPATLGLIRVLAGAMLLYTHAVWTLRLDDFFGPQGWLNEPALHELYRREPAFDLDAMVNGAGRNEPAMRGTMYWSHFDWNDSRAWRWGSHFVALGCFTLLTLGLWTRPAAIASAMFTMSYMHRMPVALFGLDKINMLLALYLAIGPSGACYSLDRWLRTRRERRPSLPEPSVGANIAIRLIQLHMCAIYFFAGVSKLQGAGWWSGYAMWMAFANQEYQTLDMTWTAAWPRLLSVMCHVTVLWELTYPALIWPKVTRPIVLVLAVPLHLGISICLGMITFGLVMLIGNVAFLPPEFVRGVLRRLARARAPAAGEAPPLVPEPTRRRQAASR